LINPFLVQVQFSSPFNEAKFAAIAASGAAAYGLTISGALYGWGANSGAVAGFINETLLPSDYLPPRLLGEFPPGSKLFTSTERSTEEVPRGRLFVVSADGSTMSVAGISDCRSFLPLTVPCSSDSLHVQALVPLPRTGLPVDASIVKVAGGSAFTVVLMSNGAIYAIGDGSSGQMGNGFFTSATEWQRVKITSPCRDIAAANAAVQAVCDGFSEPYMWGSSEYGLILQSGSSLVLV
jgi:alpha-tubulin suppressor-like RCC1 family protein